MIIGIGIDLVEVPRIELAISRWGSRFESRVFTEKELIYCNSKKDKAQRLACRFAAKEAMLKALGTGWRNGIDWKEIEVTNDKLGKPIITLCGKTEEISNQLGVRKILLSISSTENYGAAQVVLVSE
jgi:holo-[acyl-carrier protein] synthase